MRRRSSAVSIGLVSCVSNNAQGAYDIIASGGDSGAFFKTLGSAKLFPTFVRSNVHAGIADVKSTKLPRCAEMQIRALKESLKGIDLSQIDAEKIGVYFGSSVGGVLESENALEKFLDGDSGGLRALRYYECSAIAELVAKYVNARGECATFSTACSSSSLALESACLAIEEGRLDAAIVCGADTLSRITANGFGSLKLLSQSNSKPFDANRDGINLGEAAGVVIILARDVAKKLSMPILAEFSGFGSTCDAYHATAPHPEGEGAERAISLAISSANISTDDVGFYCAHGTGTAGNDLSESVAIKKIFVDKLPAFASVKGIFGHTLGASGILNAILSIITLHREVMPQNAGFSIADEKIGISPLTTNKKIANNKVILSCSIGFGGNNSCAVIAKSSNDVEYSNKELKEKIFIYGLGELSVEGETNIVDGDSLLKDISPLKRRRWAKLQKMALSVSRNAVGQASPCVSGTDVCVSFASGAGMTAETQRFVESVIKSDEAEPLPTSFTNSVYNAPASLIAMYYGYKGYNCATSSKEVSFESALLEAMRRIRRGSVKAGLVVAADEYASLAENYLQNFVASKRETRLTDAASAYFVGTKDACNNPPLAEILAVDIRRAEKSSGAELERIRKLLANSGFKPEDIIDWYCPTLHSGFKAKFLSELFDELGVVEVIEKSIGGNYSASSFAISSAITKGSGLYAQYSLSSTGLAAITIFKVL